MKKIIFCFSFVCMGLLSSCVDKNELVDEESAPSWLGESIYGELQNPAGRGLLNGTFNTYLRLINDVGYGDVLNRTGSKTVFPANDEAFDRFFSSGTWPGVHSYEDLSDAQKKLLVNSSMLDNALLTNMLSNVASTSGDNITLTPGMVLKHKTTISRIDSVTWYPLDKAKDVYPNNSYFERFSRGMAAVMDATTPMLVHFTPEYMLSNGITTSGSGSDFSILVGGEYQDGDTYIYRDRVTAPNVTCQNGYIHQVADVIVPPGNMAQVLKNADDLTIISHMFDRFAVPYYEKGGNNLTYYYQTWYKAEQDAGHNMAGIINPDSIFEIRYVSELSQGGQPFNNDAGGEQLVFDIGWNEYYSGNADQSLMDIAALFVPNDETIKNYFVNGAGKPIIERYCADSGFPNTPENVIKNIDFIPMNVVNKLLSNMMQLSFRNTVPSKFSKITDNESGDFMGITVNELATKNGEPDVRIANNGVIYVMDRVLSPNSYSAVSSPTLFNTNMNIINWIIENKSMNGSTANPYSLGLDFYAYLLAMKANFALFLPTDEAFSMYYIDPARLGRDKSKKNDGPIAIRYTWRGVKDDPKIIGVIYSYDPDTHQIGDSLDVLNFGGNMDIVRTQLADLMNYCTIVLGTNNEYDENGNLIATNKVKLGANNYYKAKNGGGLKISLNGDGTGTINAGSPRGNVTISKAYDDMANGTSYVIDQLIQGPLQSVYSVISDRTNYPQFSEFANICEVLSNSDLIQWACGFEEGALTEDQQLTVNSYRVFTDQSEMPNCLDRNVRFFSMYNYTVYVPNNAAMAMAYGKRLPSAENIVETYQECLRNPAMDSPYLRKEILNQIIALRDFAYYHFQNTSVYADNEVESMSYKTFLVDSSQRNVSLGVSGGNGNLYVKDVTGHTVGVNDGSSTVNIMARDFQFGKVNGSPSTVDNATYVEASSFAVLHEISEPLYYKSGDLDRGVSSAMSRRMSLRR